MRVEGFGNFEVVGYEAPEDFAAVVAAYGVDVANCDIGTTRMGW